MAVRGSVSAKSVHFIMHNSQNYRYYIADKIDEEFIVQVHYGPLALFSLVVTVLYTYQINKADDKNNWVITTITIFFLTVNEKYILFF